MLCKILSINFWKKNISEDILGKIDKKLLSRLADFGHEGGGVWGRGVNPLKKENLGQKVLSDNVEWNSRKL